MGFNTTGEHSVSTKRKVSMLERPKTMWGEDANKQNMVHIAF